MTLQERIEVIGIKKQWLAIKIGISPSMFSHWLAGRRIISPMKIEKLEKVIKDIETTLNIKN